MNKQGIFNKVKQHLLTQNERAVGYSAIDNHEFCRYRGTKGMSCAFGILIPDELYETAMEDKGVAKLVETWPEIKKWLSISCGSDVDFLQGLQKIHDSTHPTKWESALKGFAIGAGLYYE
jgi:hypothetical protein